MADSLYGALGLAVLIAAPVLLLILAVSMLVGVFRRAARLDELAVSFVPKFLLTALALAVLGGWMGGQLVEFARMLLTEMPGVE